MKKNLLLFVFTALFTNLNAQQAEQEAYTGFLTQALEAVQNGNEQEFTINMKYFSTAIEKDSVTPEILTEENYKLYSKCLLAGALEEYENFDIEQARRFAIYNTEDYPDNLFILGYLSYLEEDYAKAIEWYEKASEKGNEGAMRNLGIMYYDEENYTKAKEWFEKASEKGDEGAMFILGVMYYNGLGVAQDSTKARYWYEKAAENGFANAMFSLGIMYYNGLGVAQDYTKAKEWYEKAADKNYPDAIYNLGFMYYNGEGVAQDFAKAKEWFKKSCDTGDKQGCENYEAIK